jgi:hypothetical protein
MVCTFPTTYVYDPAWIEEVARVLQDGGKLIVVEMASFASHALLPRGLEWLYHATGQRAPAPELAALLRGVKLSTRRETIEVNGSTVSLVLALKVADQQQSTI